MSLESFDIFSNEPRPIQPCLDETLLRCLVRNCESATTAILVHFGRRNTPERAV